MLGKLLKGFPSGGRLQTPDLFQQRGCRFLVDKGDRYRPPAPAGDFDVADDLVHRPVAALDEDIRPAFENALQWRVFVKPGDERNAFERGHDRQPVGEGVDRAVVAFAQSFD